MIPLTSCVTGILDIKGKYVVPTTKNYLEPIVLELVKGTKMKNPNSETSTKSLPNGDSRPVPKYELGDVIQVPVEICETKQARIVGYEWINDNKGANGMRLKVAGKSWAYLLVENSEWNPHRDRMRWYASEEEILSWGNK